MLDDAQLDAFARVVADLVIAGREGGVRLRSVLVDEECYRSCLARANAQDKLSPKMFLSHLGIWIYRSNMRYLRPGLIYPIFTHSLN